MKLKIKLMIILRALGEVPGRCLVLIWCLILSSAWFKYLGITMSVGIYDDVQVFGAVLLSVVFMTIVFIVAFLTFGKFVKEWNGWTRHYNERIYGNPHGPPSIDDHGNLIYRR